MEQRADGDAGGGADGDGLRGAEAAVRCARAELDTNGLAVDWAGH